MSCDALWRSDRDAAKRLQDEIAQTLCVSSESISYAFDDARLSTLRDDTPLDEYRVVFRDAVLDHMRATISITASSA